MQSSSEVPSAAELVSAIEKLVKTKMVSLFAGLSVHSCGPENSPFVLVALPAWKTPHFVFFSDAKVKYLILKYKITTCRWLLLYFFPGGFLSSG